MQDRRITYDIIGTSCLKLEMLKVTRVWKGDEMASHRKRTDWSRYLKLVKNRRVSKTKEVNKIALRTWVMKL